MNLSAVCVPQTPALFPELSCAPWSDCSPDNLCDENNAIGPAGCEASVTKDWSDEDLILLARDFLERSESLIDAVGPPAWEDEDDIFGGEVFEEERAEYLQLSTSNLSPSRKEDLARQLMANEATRYPGCSSGFLVALSLTYRKILLDRLADPRDKVEVLRRVYSSHEPEWMTAEIVYLHLVLLDQCRYLSRPNANLERKQETLEWIFTYPELEDRPFSFKNCVKLVTGNAPDFGSVHRRVKEGMRPVLAEWLRESLAHKRTATDSRQPELFDM